MKAKSIILRTILGVGLLTLVLSACEGKEDKPYGDVATTDLCLCESDWFPHSQTPAPPEGKGSPFDTTSTTNCIFQQWTWQKFLWLTKQPTDTSNPLFIDSLNQVTSEMQAVPAQAGASVVLQSFKQAGPDGILQTTPAYSASGTTRDTVFYAIYVNDIMQNAAIAFADSLINGTLPRTNTSTFPIGSLELKTSWVPTSSLPSGASSDYYTTTGAILQQNGSYKQTEVALLGMHVVGVVINHPEFIWGTFEHKGIAPLFDWDSQTVSSSTDMLLFAQGLASDINGIRWNSGADSPYTADQAFMLYEYGTPRLNDSTFMKTSQTNAAQNFNNIDSLNVCVAAAISGPWNNYFQNGALWIDTDDLTPQQQADTLVYLAGNLKKSEPGDITRGSVNAANLTMETYTQTFQHTAGDIAASNLVNCFTCHNAQAATDTVSPIYISHLFDGYLSTRDGATVDKVNQQRLLDHIATFVKAAEEDKKE